MKLWLCHANVLLLEEWPLPQSMISLWKPEVYNVLSFLSISINKLTPFTYPPLFIPSFQEAKSQRKQQTHTEVSRVIISVCLWHCETDWRQWHKETSILQANTSRAFALIPTIAIAAHRPLTTGGQHPGSRLGAASGARWWPPDRAGSEKWDGPREENSAYPRPPTTTTAKSQKEMRTIKTWLTMEVDTTLGEPRSQSRSHTRLSLHDDSSFIDVKMYNDIQWCR